MKKYWAPKICPTEAFPEELDGGVNLLSRYNLTARKRQQSYKLNYFITQRLMFLTRSDSQKKYNTYRC